MLDLSMFAPSSPPVAADSSFERVRLLDRRPETDVSMGRALSTYLRKRPFDSEGRPNELFVPQVAAIRELVEVGGLFGPMQVGSGKTLVTLLAATMTQAQQPVLVIPARLREKTKREYTQYFQDWHVRLPVLVSYEELGRPDRMSKMFDLAPDLLILDEAHKVRNMDSAVTRRMGRYIAARSPIVACLSGTLMTSQLMDYWHLLIWSLRSKAPVPLMESTAGRWAQAVDRDVGSLQRLSLGPLATLPDGLHAWIRGSRGVVPTPGSDCVASITMSRWRPTLSPTLIDMISEVERTATRPDGEPLEDFDVPDVMMQLAQGFYYVWDPMPPDWWLAPRRSWSAYVRAVLDEHLPGFDSSSQVANALIHGSTNTPPAAPEGAQLYAAWRAVRDNFVPNRVPVWVDTAPLEQARKYTKGKGYLVWTRHMAVGYKLHELGVPYFGAGTSYKDARPGETIAMSIQAHSTGSNLQAWGRNLILTPGAKATGWEQLVGRTHRTGQARDNIIVEVIDAIPYHRNVMRRALAEAKADAGASGFDHKLVIADWIE